VKIVAQGDALSQISTRSMTTGRRRDTGRSIDLKEQGTMDWRDHAACRDEDPELFFPVGTSGPALLQIAEAKAVCGRCSVSSECLKWALALGQDAGVWGGLSEDERRALKRRNAGNGTRINA
jgi:WhiB family redox-sensing transcriptional regulator